MAGAIADMLMGRKRSKAWYQVYRALGHGNAKNVCRNTEVMRGFPPEIQGFADRFVVLQEARNRVNYALDGRSYKLDVLTVINLAEIAIGVQSKHRRT